MIRIMKAKIVSSSIRTFCSDNIEFEISEEAWAIAKKAKSLEQVLVGCGLSLRKS